MRDLNPRSLGPKPSAIPNFAKPGYSIFCSCGQTCGQRPMFERFCETRRGEKLRFYKGFRGFGFFRRAGGVTCSQTKRDTKLRTTRMMFSFAAGEGYKLRCNGTTAGLSYRMGAKKAMVFFFACWLLASCAWTLFCCVWGRAFRARERDSLCL